MTVGFPVQGLPQYTTTGQEQTRLSFLPLHFLLFRTLQHALSRGVSASRGETQRRKKGRDHLRDTLPLWFFPYYRPDCESETKQQQRRISCGFCSVRSLRLLEGSLHEMDGVHTPVSATHFTISMQRPFLVIQTLRLLHKNESQLSHHKLLYIETYILAELHIW